MKKFIAIVLVITTLLVAGMGIHKIAQINKTRYTANATVRLTMESNGTDEYADDEIINYWER